MSSCGLCKYYEYIPCKGFYYDDDYGHFCGKRNISDETHMNFPYKYRNCKKFEIDIKFENK